MNIQATKINTANALAKGKIALHDLEQKLNALAQKASKTIKMAGFRQGKVPVNIVKSRYKDSLQQDAEREMIQEMLTLALKDLKIDPKGLVGDPLITKFEKGDEAIDVEIKISLFPEFTLEGIESKLPTPKIPTPNQKDIDERLDMIALAQAPLTESKEKIVKKNHTVNIDFEGFVDGVAFEGGKANGFDLTIGSGQFIPGFEDALIGSKLGEEKNIQEKIKSAIDDVLAQKVLGNEKSTLQELQAQIKTELTNELKMRHYNDEMKQKCLDALDNGFDFDLPEAIIEKEMDVLFRNALSSMPQDELKIYQQDAQKAKDKRESFREEAKKSVKVTFIIDAIAKHKKIDVSDNEVMSAIYYESMMQGQNPKEILEYYKNNNLLPAVKMAMIEDRVLHRLLDEKAGIENTNLDKKTEPSKPTKASAQKTSKSKTVQKAQQ